MITLLFFSTLFYYDCFIFPGTEALTEEAPETEEGDKKDDWESCSEDEDDSDSEWIDVHHSSDEEQVRNKGG